ncbi:MAG: T9SS C-terminal target domain-containing protein [Ignavibacteriae bacterium]|nr:MAG: T9SS C-terminal target domain-containing protein [Ignavibacteriota bacterium]
MKKFFLSTLLLILLTSITYTQPKLLEGFETADSNNLPAGWAKWIVGNYYPDPYWNWTVRDSGLPLPGLQNATSKSHTGLKSCGVSWWVGNDTGGTAYVPEAWLITKRIPQLAAGDVLKFWASGGSANYLDSIQVFISTIDSTPSSMIFKLASIIWPVGTTYGVFTEYTYDLSTYAGFEAWIGFRYNTDITQDGFFVFVDDVFVGSVIGIKPVGSNIPNKFELRQNYPNPFNPKTVFEFDLPKGENVNIVIYNMLGQEVKTLLNEFKSAGTYKVDFDASALASGTYYYRIIAGDFVDTKKMVLVK